MLLEIVTVVLLLLVEMIIEMLIVGMVLAMVVFWVFFVIVLQVLIFWKSMLQILNNQTPEFFSGAPLNPTAQDW